jgi:hypothetical protein
MSRRSLIAILLCLPLLLAFGCDEVDRSSFGGVIGQVGQPAIANCDIEIYDALRFVSLSSTEGRIATGRSTSGGRFKIKLNDKHLGRPLILVARPGPNALYRDFGAPGTPEIAFDAPRQPWVSVLNEWLGGEDVIAINPITTLVFHSLMRLPVSEVGGGKARFDRNYTNAVAAAVAANFGLKNNLSTESLVPPKGPDFVSVDAFYLEESGRHASYTAACLQLAVAANDFVGLTADPNDTALDFYEALARDARDGVIDGQVHGTPDDYLNEVPAVVGIDTDGASLLMRYIAGLPLTTQQQGFASAQTDGDFNPNYADMLAIQVDATGSLLPTRVEYFDMINIPYSSDIELTLRGQGFRRTDRFIFRSNDDSKAEFAVDRDSVGIDGEFLFHSATELRLRIPDFDATTKEVPFNLRVPNNADFRIVRLILENKPELTFHKRDVEHILTRDARLTDRTEPLLLHAEIGRVDAAGDLHEAAAGNNVYPGAQDPATLDPSTQDVYELRVRVYNPDADDLNNIGLDLTLSAFQQLGGIVVADLQSGSATGRAVIFPDALAQTTLSTRQQARLDYRFKFLDSAIPLDLAEGAPVRFTPVLAGVDNGSSLTVTTADVVGFNRTVQLSPALADPTAVLDTPAAPVLPATIDAGDEFEIEMTVSSSPRAGGLQRSLAVEWVEITIDFDGETTVLRLTDAFFETPVNSGLVLVGLRRDSTDGLAFPLSLEQIADAETLILTVRTDPARSGALQASFTVHGRDSATETLSTESSGTAAMTVNP